VLRLFERTALDDITVLDRVWESTESFLFLPDKSGVDHSWFDKAEETLPEELRQAHFALLTSGSTGRPKLVIGNRRRAEALARVLHLVQQGNAVREAVLALPLNYCYSFVNQWLCARVTGRRLVITRGFSRPDELGAALEGAESAMLCLVGAQVQLFTRYFREREFPGVIRLHFAGGPFPQENIVQVRRLFPNAVIFNNYGCAEAMPRLTLRPAEVSDDGANVGRPLPGVEMKTDDEGRILFRSPYGAVAFYDEEGLTRIGAEDWVLSGDIGEPIENGCWRITGRANQVFKRYGEKIALPRLLETVYGRWEGQAAFYREKESSGEEGHVLLLAPQASEEQVRAVLAGFRKGHPRTHWPLRIESAPSFPLLANGKLDLAALGGMDGRTVHWRQRLG